MNSGTAAERRLEQAHQLWHRALESYPSVDDFCLAVNNLLQILRTVTFVLQKSLKHQDGFEASYADRQREMNGDAVLRWAVEARNHIEKEGDLDAVEKVVTSWHLRFSHQGSGPACVRARLRGHDHQPRLSVSS